MANLSARVGSISDNQLGGWHSYRCAKHSILRLDMRAEYTTTANSFRYSMAYQVYHFLVASYA